MKQMKLVLSKSLLIGITILGFSSCCCDQQIDTDIAELNKIFLVAESEPIDSELHIYIDYSKCVKLAIDEAGSLYQSIIAPLTSKTGHKQILFSIRDTGVNQETDDFSKMNSILNNFTEQNYAELEVTINLIANNNNQSLLITDGEFIKNDAQKERTNYPYMAEAVSTWLKKDRSIYVIIEEYKESGKSKNRFYFFFVDDKLENNIYTKLDKSGKLNHDGIRKFKFSSSDFKVIRDKHRLDNESFDFSSDTINSTEFVQINNSWEDIINYTLYATDDAGNEIPDGKPFIRGLNINSVETENYYLTDIDFKVEEITGVLLDSLYDKSKAVRVTEGFSLNKELFKNTGTIEIKLKDNIFNIVDTKCGGIYKATIYIKSVTTKKPHNSFTWNSIFLQKTPNISVFESFRSAIEDNPNTLPTKINDGVLYTIYFQIPKG